MGASMTLFYLVCIAAFVLGIRQAIKTHSKARPKPSLAKATYVSRANDELTVSVTPVCSKAEYVVTINGVDHDFSQDPLFHAITQHLARGDWNAARRYLQKIAYGMVNGSDAEKESFKIFMMGFASGDPLYAQCIQSIQPILQTHPEGVRQTSLYPHMAAAPDTETARYVLYYADLLGAVRRTKKGNSYTVFPGQ